MMNTTRRLLLLASAWLATTTLATAQTAAQAAYPSQPIKIIVPYPPGGGTDTLARMVGAKLQEEWGQPVVVENKPGASGSLGNDAVAKAPADGYTVLMGITALIQMPPLMPKLPYDPIRDLAPVVEVARVGSIFAVPVASPAQSLKEFIALVKAQPGRFSYGSYGNGTSSHIQGSLLNQQAGLDLAHVPYKGAGPLVNDLLGGQVSSAFVDLTTATPHLKSGKFRVLAATGAERSRVLPDVPTFTELGLKSFEPYGWFGMFMPAATPPTVVGKFSAAVGRILRTPEVSARVEALGLTVVGNKPEEFAASVRNDAALYARIIRETKITLE